jgi:hypothetical protein
MLVDNEELQGGDNRCVINKKQARHFFMVCGIRRVDKQSAIHQNATHE